VSQGRPEKVSTASNLQGLDARAVQASAESCNVRATPAHAGIRNILSNMLLQNAKSLDFKILTFQNIRLTLCTNRFNTH